jgi:hypothetical protein
METENVGDESTHHKRRNLVIALPDPDSTTNGIRISVDTTQLESFVTNTTK